LKPKWYQQNQAWVLFFFIFIDNLAEVFADAFIFAVVLTIKTMAMGGGEREDNVDAKKAMGDGERESVR
jgi:hypothetical protein